MSIFDGQPDNTMASGGGFYGDPLTMGLLGLAAGFGQAAMPSRMRVPLGAAIGMGASGLQGGLEAANKAQLTNAQMQYMLAHGQQATADAKMKQLQLQMMPGLAQDISKAAGAFGGGTPLGVPSSAPIPSTAPATGTEGGAAYGGINVPASFAPHVAAASAAFNVPAPVLAWVGQHENNFQNRPGMLDTRDNQAPLGPWQFKPSTGAQFGLSTPADFADPQKSTNAAAQYLRKLYDQTGDWESAIARYGTFSPQPGSASDALRQKFRTFAGQFANPETGVGPGATEANNPIRMADNTSMATATDVSGTPTAPAAPQATVVAQPGSYNNVAMAAQFRALAARAGLAGIPAAEKAMEGFANMALQVNKFRPATFSDGTQGFVDVVTGQEHRFPADVQPLAWQQRRAQMTEEGKQAALVPADIARTRGQEQAKADVALGTAGPIAAATEQGKGIGGAATELVNVGSREFPVWRTKASLIAQQGGAPGIPATQQGGQPTNQFPALAPELIKGQVQHDAEEVRKINESLAGKIAPQMITIQNMRNLVPQMAGKTGAMGEVRQTMRNYFQTFLPDSMSEFLKIDAATPQEFMKNALLLAGKAENEAVGAKGGFNLTNLYLNSFPNLETQPQAMRDMMNVMAVQNQHTTDFVTGLTAHQNENWQKATGGNAHEYRTNAQYQQDFAKNNPPQIYVAAAAAMNGKPYAEWSKGLTDQQKLAAAQIVRRIDPTTPIQTDKGVLTFGAQQ